MNGCRIVDRVACSPASREPERVSAEVTARVLNYVLADLKPHLPGGVGIKVTSYPKWTTVQRADEGSQDFHGVQIKTGRDEQGRPIGESSGVTVRNLAPSLPLIPRSARRQIAAKHALDILLGLAYPQAHKDGFRKSTDYGIVTADHPRGVMVSYQLPGTELRIELNPLPEELFD
jgi:hypothetical protein